MKRATILVVDDDPKYLTFLRSTLKRGGFAVLTATDGCEVPDLLESTHVDAMVLDLQMPGMNGWEVIRALRDQAPVQAGQPRPRPKIVVLSGRSEDETAAFVRRLGADLYLTKPLWGDQIVTVVRSLLAG